MYHFLLTIAWNFNCRSSHTTLFPQSQVNHHSSNNETYQERLARLEGDKESLILQVCLKANGVCVADVWWIKPELADDFLLNRC